jgi:hypothetical protein
MEAGGDWVSSARQQGNNQRSAEAGIKKKDRKQREITQKDEASTPDLVQAEDEKKDGFRK